MTCIEQILTGLSTPPGCIERSEVKGGRRLLARLLYCEEHNQNMTGKKANSAIVGLSNKLHITPGGEWPWVTCMPVRYYMYSHKPALNRWDMINVRGYSMTPMSSAAAAALRSF